MDKAISLVCVFLLALCLGGISASADCSLPPSLWCSDGEVAKTCGVEAQCLQWERTSRMARFGSVLKNPHFKKATNLTLAYESLCPGCRSFIMHQLWPTWQLLKDYLTIDLLPYGNAHEYYNAKSGRWIYECQHGPKECQGNLIETCAIYITKRDETKFFPFIYCLETGDPVNDAQRCAQQTGIDWNRISDCVNGTEGNIYQHAVALDTPKDHKYVPWVIFNGVHTEKIEDMALSNLKELVCDSIQGPKPAPCLKTQTKAERCMNNHN